MKIKLSFIFVFIIIIFILLIFFKSLFKNNNYIPKKINNKIENIVIEEFYSGNNLKLGDVANVYEKFSDDEPQLKFIDNKSSVIMTVLSTKNEDLLESADKIRLYIEDFNKKNKNIIFY